MKWLKRMLIALAVLLVIAVALPFFISLNDYIPRIEKEVSARLKEPVSIKSITFAALPLPHVTLDGIKVGTTDDIKLGKVLVTPDLFSLLQSTRVIKSIEIDSLVLTLRLAGHLDVSQLDLRQVASMLSPGTHVSGKLNAKPVFSASAASADRLMNALRLETPFSVQNGALHGVDIQKAATNLVGQATTGGETRFEHLSGHLVMEHGSYRFTQLRIDSGALAAEGNVSISPKKALSGRINAQVKAVGISANMPLNVGGTVDAPLLYPTGGTMAGAAVGTVILGPGFGTSVGAKVGGWAESLFGTQDEKRPKQ